MAHYLDQEAKSNMCCIHEISHPTDGFMGGGFERAKSGNGKTSKEAIIVFQRKDDGA